jgi:RNA polymerase sigma-70 factor (ECF subfamily)
MEQDTELLQACIAGNSQAQFRFYERYSPRLYAVCLRYARDAGEANDFLQEGFIKIFRDLSTYRAEGNLEAWMHRIMVNTVLSWLRKKKLQFLPYVEPPESQYSDAEIIGAISATELIAVLNHLPQGYRTVLNLYAIEGYSHAEIAALLDISEGTSRSQYLRAKIALKNRLEQLTK